MKRFFTLIAITTFFMTTAHGALLVEPAVGYNFGKMELGDADYSPRGPSFGGRLGYQNFGFQLGVDYLNSVLDMNDDDFDSSLKTSEWGAFAGFEFPVFIRVYAGYIFSATGEADDKDERKNEFLKGSGMKAGLGFTGLPFIDINLEYRSISYDEIEVDGEEGDSDAKYNSIMLGLSVPFTL